MISIYKQKKRLKFTTQKTNDKKDADYQYNKIREIMSVFDFYVLQRAVGWNVDKTVNEVIERQENKLHTITEMTNIPYVKTSSEGNINPVQ